MRKTTVDIIDKFKRNTSFDITTIHDNSSIEQLYDNELSNKLHEVIDTLSERESCVIISRFFEKMTLKETGEKYGVTRERIRQIEAKALRKLRHPSRKYKLIHFLEETEKEKILSHDAKILEEREKNRLLFDVSIGKARELKPMGKAYLYKGECDCTTHIGWYYCESKIFMSQCTGCHKIHTMQRITDKAEQEKYKFYF